MRGSIRKRSSASFTIQASGGFNDAGKRVRVTRTIHGSRRDAERALTKLLHEVDTGTVALDGWTPLATYMVDKWLPHIRTRVRPSTYGRYEALVRVQIVPRIGRVKLSGLRPAHIQKVLDGMIAGKAAPASVLQCHRVLSAALRQAVRWQVLAVNPSEAVRPPRPERVPLQVPEPAQVRAILEAARGTVHEVPLLLAATTGMRRGEVLGLRWSAVDLDAGLARVVVTLQKSRGTDAEYVSPKTDRSRRTISLPPSTVARLRQHRKEQAERRLFVGGAWHDTDLVCERGDGEHLDPDGFSNAFSRYAVAAKVPEARLHDLRHAFATTLLTAGVNAKVASEALGHASTAFTMDTYQHVLPSMGQQVAAAIETALGGPA
jgi:integrase